MTDEQINKMVDRFLCWPLPIDFSPDGGISFERKVRTYIDGEVKEIDRHSAPPGFWPIGTNLFTADQARAMILHMLGESARGIDMETKLKGVPVDAHKRNKIKDETGCSIFEAHALARRDALLEAIKGAKSLDDIKKILYEIAFKPGQPRG